MDDAKMLLARVQTLEMHNQALRDLPAQSGDAPRTANARTTKRKALRKKGAEARKRSRGNGDSGGGSGGDGRSSSGGCSSNSSTGGSGEGSSGRGGDGATSPTDAAANVAAGALDFSGIIQAFLAWRGAAAEK